MPATHALGAVLFTLLGQLATPPGARTIVLPLRAGPGVCAALAHAVTDAVEYRIRQVTGSSRVLGETDIHAIERVEAKAAKFGEANVEVLTRLGHALGASEVVEGSLRRVGGGLLLNLRRVDARSAVVLHEGEIAVHRGDLPAVLAAVDQGVGKLYPRQSAPVPPEAPPSMDDLSGRVSRLVSEQTRVWKGLLDALAGRSLDALAGKVPRPRRVTGGIEALATNGELIDWYRQMLAAVRETSMGPAAYHDAVARAGIGGFSATSGVAVELASGLAWQRSPEPIQVSQGNARRICETITIAGRSGFRLPSVAELFSLVRPGAPPTIDRTSFPGTPAAWFWTSDTVAPGRGLAISFFDGQAHESPSAQPLFVRCVEGPAAPPPGP